MSQRVIEQVRQFNRFYTKQIGLLNTTMPKTKHTLPEARILFELSQAGAVVASDLAKELSLDPSYLSRILVKFEKSGLLTRTPSANDSRKQIITLTPKGKEHFAEVQGHTNAQIADLLAPLSESAKQELLTSMETIQRVLGGDQGADFITFRSHQPGDIGYLSYQHSKFYAQNYGFDITFDSYVAGAMVKFIETFNEQKEKLWVVEKHGKIMGSIAIVNVDDTTAQLRWFLLEPELHGKGVGKKLMRDAVQFCRDKGYANIILWTFEDLDAARGLYKREGFSITKKEAHPIWGQYLTEEMWELRLR